MIRSCRDGIHKVVELLQLKFPNVSKSQLNRKVREISHFVDNHWKVIMLSHCLCQYHDSLHLQG